VTEVHHGYILRDAKGAEQTGDVVVTGPGRDPDELGMPLAAARA
jgi:hypothetical protein